MPEIFNPQDFDSIIREATRLAKGQSISREVFDQAVRNVSNGNFFTRIGRIGSALQNVTPDILRDIKATAILGVAGLEGANLIERAITERRLDLNPIPRWAEGAFRFAVEQGSEAIGAPLFDMFVRTPTGLALSSIPGQEGSEAVRVLERLFGVGVALDFGAGEVDDVLKLLMGNNAPRGLTQALRNLPMNVGVNWATGFLLSQLVWSAYMPPLVEQAMAQVRPTRLEIGQLAALLKRELIGRSEFDAAMAKLGWRDGDIDKLLRLDETTLNLGDMQNAFLQGLMPEDEVRHELAVQGYTPSSIDRLVEIYLKRSETAGGDQLRAVAQRGYIDGHLSEDQYRAYLGTAGVPQRSIDLEVEAATLVRAWQHRQLTVTDIKRLRLSGVIDDQQAVSRLMADGWTQEDAQLLLQGWLTEASKTRSGLTEAQVLAYLRAGVLTEVEAYDRLVAMGKRAADASFLVKNPTAITKGRAHALTAGTVIAAYKDGVIGLDDAVAKLIDGAGLTEEAARLRLQVANVELNRGAKPKQAAKDLTPAQILEAFRLGLVADTWAVRELITAGYDDGEAHLLVTMEETKLTGAVPSTWAVLT